MQLKEAVKLINSKIFLDTGRQLWADLGCGSGIFTIALASLLKPGSLIYAVDKNKNDLDEIPGIINSVQIQKLNIDFHKEKLPPGLEGIIMANSLHFIKDKNSFIKSIEPSLKKLRYFLIVEYDTDSPNNWVPFPISYDSLPSIFRKENYILEKLSEYPSLYQRSNIYSALAIKKNTHPNSSSENIN